ncbi:type II secretion system protein [Candidatus Pelagadaptatus aseana]|uniref:type II secretion system protein n=1 Tax=Candidatus Pelagadaptatus aseana TaxID=3120508 RepID=UPI003C701F83
MRKNGFTIIELAISLCIVGMLILIYARFTEPDWYIHLLSKDQPYLFYAALFIFPVGIYSNIKKALFGDSESNSISTVFLYFQAALWAVLLVMGLGYVFS